MNMWTSAVIGACLGVIGTVVILACGFMNGVYTATAWTLFFVAIIVAVMELVRRVNFPST